MSQGNNPYNVKPGQVWADNDWRGYGRLITVLEVGDTHAVVRSGPKGGRTSRIRLDRFRPNSTGYRFVKEAEGEG